MWYPWLDHYSFGSSAHKIIPGKFFSVTILQGEGADVYQKRIILMVYVFKKIY